jgi:hypothetical protein
MTATPIARAIAYRMKSIILDVDILSDILEILSLLHGQ